MKVRKYLKNFIPNLRFALFRYLLKKFCEKDLDQWERWKLKTKYGDVFIEISRRDDGYNYDRIR